MIDHIFLFIYIITVGVTFAVVALSLLYWFKKKDSGRFNTLLFIIYLAILLMLAGVKFYWEELLSGGRAVIIGTGLAESAGYALLLCFLPATVNHVIGRHWTGLRMIASITATVVYFVLGALYLLTGFLMPISLAAAFIFFLALSVILVDILKSISLVKRGATRITILLATLLTIIFLPLVLVGHLLGRTVGHWAVSHPVRFLFLSLYYFWMALLGIIFYMRELILTEATADSVSVMPENLPLTEREKDIAESLTQGLTYGEIAENLEISPNTVRNHVANLYKKLSVRSKVELIGVFRGERPF